MAGTSIESQQQSVVGVVEAFEPNDTVADATPAETDTIYVSHLSSADDVDLYSIFLEEGSRLALSLSDLPADYDLVVFGPTNQDPLVPLGDQEITPTEPPVRIGFAGSENSNKPSSLADLPRQGDLPIISVSNAADTETEIIDIPLIRRTGTYHIQVSGHSGAFSPDPYGLFVNVVDPPAPIVCAAQDFNAPGQVGSLPSPADLAGVNTLILTNRQRLFGKYDADANVALDALDDLVAYLGTNPALGLSAAVIPIDGDADVRAAFGAFDTGSCEPETVNDAVREIAQLIGELRDADPNTTIEHIIFAGDDDVVPFARLVDDTTIANENSFSWTFAGDDPTVANTLFGVAEGGFYLSDEPYGDLDPIQSGPRTLFVADTSLGRLVETPSEIAGQVATYIAFDGVLAPDTGFVSGYDFLDDGAEAVADALDALPDVDPVDRLINETWSRDDLSDALFPAGQDSPGITAINAHFDQYRALPADENAAGQELDLFSTADVHAGGNLDALTGGIVFSMGCHSGLNVPDHLFPADDPRALDWAQTFGRSRAIYVANNGYGYGETEGVELSERLMALFAENLDGSVTAGEALLFAKQAYIGTRQAEYGPFDEKVLQQATFYGLPIYTIGVQNPPAPDPVPELPSLAPLSGTSLTVDSIASNPSFQRAEAEGGSSFEASLPAGDEGATRQQSTPFSPILPTVSYDVTAVNEEGDQPVAVAQGAFITGLRTSDVPGVEPDIARPIVDLSENETEPEVADIGTEPAVFISNYRTPEGPRQQLSALAASFQSTEPDGSGVTRLFEELEFEVFYRAPGSGSDQSAPVFSRINSEVQSAPDGGGTFLIISVEVTDPSGLERVQALVGQDPDNDTVWTAVELTPQGSDRWSGALQITGDEIEFLVQAVDGNGNVARSSNKTRSFLDTDEPEADVEEIAAAATRPPDSGAFYTSPVTVSAAADGAELQFRVDDGPLVDGGPNPSVDLNPAELGDGAHTVTFVLPNGVEESVTVVFDTTGPTITLSPDNGGEVLAPVTIRFSCGDAGSGTGSCTATIDGAPVNDGDVLSLAPGSHTLNVSATDALGNGALASSTFIVLEPPADDPPPGDDPPPSDDPVGNVVYLSSTTAGSVGGVSFQDEDVLSFDVETAQWAMAFDGSDVGLAGADIDAFSLISEEPFVAEMSFRDAENVPGLGQVDDSDVVTFTGIGGTDTAGDFTLTFDGSDVLLSTFREDIDAWSSPGEDRVYSTTGVFSVVGLDGAREDVVLFDTSVLGEDTAGVSSVLIDTSSLGVTANLSGLTSDAAASAVFGSFAGSWSLGGASGDSSDVFRFTSSDGTAEVIFDGGANGFGTEIIDAVHVVSGGDVPPDPVGTPPTAVDDGPDETYSIIAGQTLAIAAVDGLLANDALGSPEGTVITFGGGSLGGDVADNPAGTTVTTPEAALLVETNGALTFSPGADTEGEFQFNYRLSNAFGSSDATVTIDVTRAPEVESTTIYLSSTTSGVVAGVAFDDEDVLSYDTATGEWQLAFDGSDVGLVPFDIDAFSLISLDPFVAHMSFRAPGNVPGVGQVDDSDIVAFTGIGGVDAVGVFSLVFDGSTAGYSTFNEDIDALHSGTDTLSVSTNGNFNIADPSGGNQTGADEDALELELNSQAELVRVSPLLDGSAVGFGPSDLQGLSIESTTGELFGAGLGNWTIGGLSGDGDDVFRFVGTATSGEATLIFDGDAAGLGNEQIDAIHVVQNVSP